MFCLWAQTSNARHEACNLGCSKTKKFVWEENKEFKLLVSHFKVNEPIFIVFFFFSLVDLKISLNLSPYHTCCTLYIAQNRRCGFTQEVHCKSHFFSTFTLSLSVSLTLSSSF